MTRDEFLRKYHYYQTFDAEEAKREAIVELIVASHGKNTTKKLAITRANMMSSSQMDNYAKNYMFAGEGRNVK